MTSPKVNSRTMRRQPRSAACAGSMGAAAAPPQLPGGTAVRGGAGGVPGGRGAAGGGAGRRGGAGRAADCWRGGGGGGGSGGSGAPGEGGALGGSGRSRSRRNSSRSLMGSSGARPVSVQYRTLPLLESY